MQKKQLTVRFDEEAINALREETRTNKGIKTRLDTYAQKAPYYLGAVLRTQAAELLHGAGEGAFVIFDSMASTESLTV